MSRLISAALFLVCTALVGWAIVAPWPASQHGYSRHAVTVAPGATVDFAVPPGTASLRLVTSAVVPPDRSARGRMQQDYAVELAWVTPFGEVRRSETLYARSRVSRWPGAEATPRWATTVLGADIRPTDPRNLLLPVDDLPGGGTLRLTAPAAGPVLLARMYGVDAAAQTGRARSDAIERAATRVGVAELDRLDPVERDLALARPWRSLAYSGLHGATPEAVRVHTDPPPLSLMEDGAAGTTLLPGQAVAVTVRGPARLRLGGPHALDGLAFVSRWDLPPDVVRPTLRREPATPIPLPGVTHAVDIVLPDAAAVSLTVANPTDREVGPLLFALVGGDSDQAWGWTTVVPRLDLDLGPDLLLVGPERVEIPAFYVGPDAPLPLRIEVPQGHPPVMLRTRPDLDHGADEVARTLQVEEVDATGRVLRATTMDVPARPARYERRAEDGGWLSEPTELRVQTLPDTRALLVRSQHRQRLAAYVEGAILGESRYEVTQPEVSVRYAREAPTRWHRLWPEDGQALVDAGQLRPFLANPRLEIGSQDAGSEQDRFSALKPRGTARATGRAWLVPGATTRGEAWCRYPAGGAAAPLPWGSEARRHRRGELLGYVHAAGPDALGQPYQVRLDGARWRQGRLTQRVERVIGVFERSHRTAQLVAPRGSTLWLRALDDGACPGAHRAVWAWPLSPGGTLEFALPHDRTQPVVVVAGLGTGEVRLVAELRGITGVWGDPGSGTYRTELVLRPGPDQALRLTDADARLRVLVGDGLRWGLDVPGLVLRVRHVAGPPAWIRVLTEVEAEPDVTAPAHLRNVP